MYNFPSLVPQCISDSKWDDWRPHLAMVISNTSANPDVNRRSISTLGDTLATRGDIHAAHFCYILSQVDFGAYGSSSSVKLVLIGANHHKSYPEFISNEAVMLTEIYEYARKLSEPAFTLCELQTFKFDLAVKMIDYGLVEKALLYIEQVAGNVINEPEKYKRSFISNVYVLGDRLKYHDPVCKDSEEDEDAASSLPWLSNLAEIVGKCEKGEIIQESSAQPSNSLAAESVVESSESQQQQPQPVPTWNVAAVKTEYGTDNNPASMMTVSDVDSHVAWQPKSSAQSNSAQYGDEVVNETQQHYQSYQQDYWAPQQQQQQTYDQQDYGARDYGQSASMQYTSEQHDAEISEIQNKWAYEVSFAVAFGAFSLVCLCGRLNLRSFTNQGLRKYGPLMSKYEKFRITFESSFAKSFLVSVLIENRYTELQDARKLLVCTVHYSKTNKGFLVSRF